MLDGYGKRTHLRVLAFLLNGLVQSSVIALLLAELTDRDFAGRASKRARLTRSHTPRAVQVVHTKPFFLKLFTNPRYYSEWTNAQEFAEIYILLVSCTVSALYCSARLAVIDEL